MRIMILILVAFLLDACSKTVSSSSDSDVYLKCMGDISSIKNGLDEHGQEMAAHIKGSKISFSGNSLLLGEDIQICSPSKDEPYFDSESCQGQTRTESNRNYGTYNKITGLLDLTNQLPDASYITGRFKCAKTDPLIR